MIIEGNKVLEIFVVATGAPHLVLSLSRDTETYPSLHNISENISLILLN
jgi:hypothetical protein